MSWIDVRRGVGISLTAPTARTWLADELEVGGVAAWYLAVESGGFGDSRILARIWRISLDRRLPRQLGLEL